MTLQFFTAPAPITKYRVTDATAVNNSAVLVNDSVLTFTGLPPATTYELTGTIFYSASTGADAALGFAGTAVGAGYAGHFMAEAPVGTATTSNTTVTMGRLTFAQQRTAGGVGAGTPVAAVIRGRLTTSTAGGDLTFQYAQAVAEVSDMVIHSSSILTLRKV